MQVSGLQAQPGLPFVEAAPLVLEREDGLLTWICPHCGGHTTGEPDETEASATADPACSFCRAEFMGLSPSAYRRLPLVERMTRPGPPAQWKAQRVMGAPPA